MARNTPISVVRSLTEPIMVMNTTSDLDADDDADDRVD